MFKNNQTINDTDNPIYAHVHVARLLVYGYVLCDIQLCPNTRTLEWTKS